MGPWGAIIMSFFGAGFFVMAAMPHAEPGIYLASVGVFVGFAAQAWRILRGQPAGGTSPDPRAERVIMWASIGEGVGIPIVAMLLGNTGHTDAILCGITLVVGLHFVPMAHAIPFRPFYALAAALIAAAVVGFALRQPLGSAVAGFSAAAALWIASAAAIRRSRPA